MALAVLTNSFVVAYSCLPASITDKWNSVVAVFFTKLVNSMTEKEIKEIPMTSLDIFVSPKESHQYNDIPGYALNEIPLGSAKQIECTFWPEDATNPAINIYTEADNIVALNQSGNVVSVVGMEVGTARIYATNIANELTAYCDVIVVDTVAPTSFEISLKSSEIELGTQATLDFNIDGGVLGHDELINSRYYDIRKLTYTSSNEEVCTVDTYGVIHPLTTGESTITVESESCSQTIDVEVVSGGVAPTYSNLHITGSNICYGNDMINDQSTHNNHYQLSIFDGETELDPEDFIWESSNELLVKVDKHGVMRGFRKKTFLDEAAVITARSKLNGQATTFNVIVKEQLPSSMYYRVEVGKSTSWNPEAFTACVGDNVKVIVGYDVNISNKNIIATISDDSFADLTLQGNSFVLNVKKVGNCSVNFESVANSELKEKIDFEFLKAGAINTDEMDDVGHSLRKAVGHAAMFAVAQVFLLITIYMFMNSRPLWQCGCLSLSIGLVIASLSELIQHFVPSRQGTFLDVLINFAGVTIGAILVITGIVLIDIIKKNKEKQNTEE